SEKKSQCLEAKKILKQWILKHHQNAVAVTCNMIKMHMLILLSTDFVETYPGADSKFCATDMWLFRFMKRNNFTLQHKTKISQKLLEDLTDKIINTCESKTVNVCITDNEKNRFTCVLTILADAGINVWFEKIWSKRPGGLAYKKERALLVLDSFEEHKTKNIKKKAREENTDLCVIPDELTSTVQLLDIIKAWNDISSEMVSKSFKKCGISNAMDGTEDDFIWKKNNENNNMMMKLTL
ncbi:8485_t:CDS:2, partial [Diversispora eburnea]